MNFNNTKKALEHYDAVVWPELAARDVQDDEQCRAWVRDEARAIQELREAFYLDTAFVNSRDTVLSCVTIDYMRKCVART